MADAADPYVVLGLTRAASDAEIKAAYRKRARESHPDANPDDPGAEARFVRVLAAYDLLKDPATRARFDAGEIDASGAELNQRRARRDYAQGAADGFGDGFGRMDPDDLFAEFMFQRGGNGGGGRKGRSGRGRRKRDQAGQGQDFAFALEVDFLIATRGGAMRITLPSGEVMDMTLPAGVRDGQTLRLRGKGAMGLGGGGTRGDALVTLTIRPHPLFRRDGDDILMTLPITIDEAVLGAKVAVPTLQGDVSLNIPPGANGGQVLRLRGRGVAGAGDQLVELRIVVPKPDDPALAAFLTEWRKSQSHDPRKDMVRGVPL